MRIAAFYLMAFFFGIVAIVQFLRLMTDTPMIIGGTYLPMSATAASAIFAVGVAVWMSMEARRRG